MNKLTAESVFRRYLDPATRDRKAWRYISAPEGGTYPDDLTLAGEYCLPDGYASLDDDAKDAAHIEAHEIAAEAIALYDERVVSQGRI